MTTAIAAEVADALGADAAERLAEDGYLLVRGFYDVERDIEPIWAGIRSVIRLVAAEHGIDIGATNDDPSRFDDGYLTLLHADRRLGGIVYDAVKQLGSFVRLVADARAEAAFALLRGATTIGLAGRGSGIRIDNPGEDRFRAWWHQEYPAQLRSLDGLVFWSPLRPVDAALGPVEILRGSHRLGVLPVARREDGGRTDAYALQIADEAAVVARHEAVSPPTEPGDLVIMDFLTVHRSGRNASDRPRWSMQSRWFNFDEPTGRAHGWVGSFAAGVALADVHPELVVDR